MVPRLTFRQLADEFLTTKRKLVGTQTANDYRSRLSPLLHFAELPANRKRWPLAMNIDTSFATEAKAFLYTHRTTRNGRAGGAPRSLSPRQIVNIMETFFGMLTWGSNPVNNRLPAGWRNPVTPEVIGKVAGKDPVRHDPLPLDLRIQLVHAMDRWQLCHLVPSMILPMRPDEAAGLLVADVNTVQNELLFGINLGEVNFTKSKVAFRLPVPVELQRILATLMNRNTGCPLLRSRRAYSLPTSEKFPTLDELKILFNERLCHAKAGQVQTEHDRKILFRQLLKDLGGISLDAMNREFKSILKRVAPDNPSTLYTLRSSVTTSMSVGAKLAHLELTYLTSHSTHDILNRYTSLDIHGEMNKYFEHISPLLEAVAQRASTLQLDIGS